MSNTTTTTNAAGAMQPVTETLGEIILRNHRNNVVTDAQRPAYDAMIARDDTLTDIAAIYASPDNRTKEQIADDDAYDLAEYNSLTSAADKERDKFRMSQINYTHDPIYSEIPDGSRARKH